MAHPQRRNSRLTATAESIGAGLGALAEKVDSWRQQRDEIVAELKNHVAAGQKLLADLGHAADPLMTAVARLRARAVEPENPGRRRGHRQSEEARAKMRAAWAARRRQTAKPGTDKVTKPTDIRATVRAVDGRHWTARQQGRG